MYTSIIIVNCRYPELVYNGSIPTLLGYDNHLPVREGTTITFSCPAGQMLTGSTLAICTGNGEWEPDPTWLMCNASAGEVLVRYRKSVEHPSAQ